jgi:hypothetical protein
MKRIVVAHQNQIVMEDTLEAALERIFPSGKGKPGPAAEPARAAAGQADSGFAKLAARAQEHYQRALKAQRDGDWALYGEEIKRLGETLDLMKKQR